MTPYLPNDVARCRPGCLPLRETCGRFLAPLPATGASVVDGRKQWLAWPCAGYRPASQCTVPAAPTRRVHPPLGCSSRS